MATVLIAVQMGILAWVPHVEAARERLDLTPTKYSTPLILALLEVESFPKGCATSQREGSKYTGAFQFSEAYVRDAGFLSVEDALADPVTQVEVLLRYMERYNALHLYQPSAVARLHKVGPRAFAEGVRHAEYEERWAQAFQVYVNWSNETPTTREVRYGRVPCT